MGDIVDIIVDGEVIKTDSKANLLDTLKQNGIDIPHFCYHPELGVDGNCRMCLVEIKGQKRPQIACDTPIKAGMEILTTSELTRSVQRGILELELINHPIDCPVCDQAGECSLQDYYMKYDLAVSRMPLSEKVDKKKRLDYGSGVVHDQERCVLCTRCVRFTTKITKTNELGLQKRGDESRIVIFPDRPINNKYAQCIVDVCPVGAMTSADFRFQRRVWHLKIGDSICQGCSKGCNIHIDYEKQKYKQEKIYRFRPRRNDIVNGHFMCDDGRYSYKNENENRAFRTYFEDKEINYTDAILSIKDLIKNKKVLFLLSPNLSLEEMLYIKKVALSNTHKVNAFSGSYFKNSDSDGYLIQSDKSSNRKSVELLNISQSYEELQKDLKSSEVVVLVDTKEHLQNLDLKKLLENKNSIYLTTHNCETSLYKAVIPIKSYTQRDGHIINCDEIIQKQNAILVSDSRDVMSAIEDIVDFDKDLKLNIEKIVLSELKIDLSQISKWGYRLGGKNE